MIVSSGPLQVAVVDGGDSARLAGPYASGMRPDRRSAGAEETVQAVVEVRRVGGAGVRALLGAVFQPTGSATLTIELPRAMNPLAFGAPATAPSQLGPRLVPGLPSDFADAAVRGLEDGSSHSGLPGGILRVDHGAHDEVESSDEAFRIAGWILAHLLAARRNGTEVGSAVRDAMADD